MYVLVAFGWYIILRNLCRGTTESLKQAKICSEETVQIHIKYADVFAVCISNGSNSNKQYSWLVIVLLLFKQTLASGTRDPMKYIRWGEEGVRASDLRPSENQARPPEAFFPFLQIDQ